MHNPAAGRHPIHITRLNGLDRSQGCRDEPATLEEVCDSRQPDMGMGSNVDSLMRFEDDGPEIVEEGEWSIRRRCVDGNMRLTVKSVSRKDRSLLL